MFKKVLKRFVGILLAVAMAVPWCLTVASADTAFVENIRTLRDLHIVTEASIGKDNLVSRGEFISAVARICWDESVDGLELAVKDYQDLPSGSPYYAGVMAATAAGLVMGEDEDNIMPDSIITADEVSIILLRLLGYNAVVNADGAEINGVRVLRGKTTMSWENVAKILVDVLDMNVVRANKQGNSVSYTVLDETVLGYYRNVYTFDGIMTGAYTTHIDSADFEVRENEAVIDGDIYQFYGFDAYDYIGYRVKGYYHLDKRTGEKIIVSIARDAWNNTLIIQADDIVEYSDKNLQYCGDGDKMKTAKMNANLDVVYNHKCAVGFRAEDMLIENGSLELIDNDKDGKYDVAKIKTYKTYVIDNVDTIHNIINLKFPVGTKMEADFGTDKDVVIENSRGYSVDMRELKQGDVLCSFESMDGDYIRATHSIEEVVGTITGVVKNSENTYVVIDDVQYGVANICLQNQEEQIKPGSRGVYALDIDGKITYISGYTESSAYAYVIAVNKEDGMEDTVYMKLMFEDGSFAVCPVKKRVNFNSETLKDANALWTVMGGREFRHQLIRCKLSSNGEITEIQTAAGLNNGGFEMFYTDYDYATGEAVKKSDGRKHFYMSGTNVIGMMVAVDSGTTVMIVPSSPDEINEKSYKVDNTYLKHNDEYWVEAHRSTTDGYVADVIVIYDEVSADYTVSDMNQTISVFDSVGRTLNEDGEEVPLIYVFRNGALLSYPAVDNEIMSTVYGEIPPKRGDIIRYGTKDGYINKLELIYSAEKNAMIAPERVTNATNTNRYYQFQVWDAYVFYRFSGFVLLSTIMPTNLNNFNYSGLELHSTAGVSVIICDSKNDMIYGGGADDLVGYKNTGGAKCSRVVVQERYSEGRVIVVYQ